MGEMVEVVGGFVLKVVEDGLRVVAARLWLSIDVADGSRDVAGF